MSNVLMYSRGVQGIAEQLNITVQRAKEISEAFYNAFPKIKDCIDFSQNMAKTQGFVQTIAGRKRRLPDMRLPEFEFKIKDASKLDSFDALDFESDATELTIPQEKIDYYWKKMSKAYGWAQKQKVKDEALAEGIEIIDNGGKIGDASRQCLNARIQGRPSVGPIFIEPYYSRVWEVCSC